MRWLWVLGVLGVALVSLSHPVSAHFVASQQGTLRFAEGRGYLVLSLPARALAGQATSAGLSWQQRAQSCIWMTGSDGRRVALAGVLTSRAQSHHDEDDAPAVITVMGVFRGVGGAADERLHIECYDQQQSDQRYRLRVSTADGQAWWVTVDGAAPGRTLAAAKAD